jgi:hypothetical protein
MTVHATNTPSHTSFSMLTLSSTLYDEGTPMQSRTPGSAGPQSRAPDLPLLLEARDSPPRRGRARGDDAERNGPPDRRERLLTPPPSHSASA